MAPDRGDPDPRPSTDSQQPSDSESAGLLQTTESIARGEEPDPAFLRQRSEQPQFTLRALLLGLLIGILIAFSNTYFGLQTGWISGMAMPSALIGFAYFKGLRTLMCRLGSVGEKLGWGSEFSEVENVLVQTVAGSVGTMPLGCGFVGVVPALEFLLKKEETPKSSSGDAVMAAVLAQAEETGGLRLPLGKLVLWALGLCFFGVVFAVPLRKEVIVREKLRFPSGTATALMIGVLHGGEKTGAEGNIEEYNRKQSKGRDEEADGEEGRRLMGDASPAARGNSGEMRRTTDGCADEGYNGDKSGQRDWQKQIRLLTYSFLVSGAYTLLSYFLPILHSLPILGEHMSKVWLWNLNPSPAYVGQGIIMGPATTVHMFLGAFIGWAILSPLAKYQGWASGDVGDWEKGSKGWIVWVSLAIMLADAIVSLGWLLLRPTIYYTRVYGPGVLDFVRSKSLKSHIMDVTNPRHRGYAPLNNDTSSPLSVIKSNAATIDPSDPEEDDYDAPPHHQIGMRTATIGLILTLAFCLFAVQFAFPGVISIGLTLLALILAMFLSIMGVRALGETDLNPVSGISKLTQLIFALVTPSSSPNAVTINLLAGAISEAGALQAGDLLQDLKTGHLLGASPKAQFYGQLIGSGVGAVVSAAVYKLYTNVYTIPGGLFQVPTGYVWVFTARLVTGQGLPPKTGVFSAGAAVIWAGLTVLRIYGNSRRNADGSKGAWWVSYVPGGIAVAVGMYNTPSFTLARTAGGVLMWWWTRWRKGGETVMIVLASGLILGEGLSDIPCYDLLARAQTSHTPSSKRIPSFFKHSLLNTDYRTPRRHLEDFQRLFKRIPEDDRGMHQEESLASYRQLLRREPGMKSCTYQEGIDIFAAAEFPARYKHPPLSGVLRLSSPWVSKIRFVNVMSKFDHRKLQDEKHLPRCAIRVLRQFAKSYQSEWRVSDKDLDRLMRGAGNVPVERRGGRWEVASSNPRQGYDVL